MGEKKLVEQKKIEEDRKLAEEAAAKQKEQEEKRKKLEEAEKKRQAQVKPREKQAKGDKMSSLQAAKGDLGKTREQLAEEKNIALSVRVAPVVNLDTMEGAQLKAKAEELWKRILKL